MKGKAIALTNSLSRAICAATLGAMEKTAPMLTGLVLTCLCPGLALVRKSGDGRSTTLTVADSLSPLVRAGPSSITEAPAVCVADLIK